MSMMGTRPLSLRLSGAHLVWALLIAATIPWRKGVYYEGGLDSVVLAKAVLSIVAMVLAMHLHGARPAHLGVPAAPVVLVVCYLAVTVVGGYAHQTLLPAAVVAVRVVILCVTVSLLYSTFGPTEMMRSLVHVIGTLVWCGTLTGLPSAAKGRLAGGVPPINPNELAFLASVCLFWLLARMLQGLESTLDILTAGGYAAVVLLTGSRSALAALCVAIVVMALRATRLSRRSFGILSFLAPTLAYVAFGTDLLSSVFLRGGERGITTLSNRTIAWDAALTSHRDPWETWFGAGLAQKKIEVPGQWWTTQLLDSSWISAIVQGGFVGAIIVAGLCLATIVRSMTAPPSAGPLWLGLIVYLCARAVLESGLFDSSVSFMVLLTTALATRAEWPSSGGEPTDLGERPVGAGAERVSAPSASR